MKTKTKKIIACDLGVLLVLFLLCFANSFMGNPLSKFMAEKAVNKYIEREYSDISLEVDRVFYNFKTTSYNVIVKSPYSIDTVFAVYCDSFGHIKHDDYEFEVENKMTTHRRLYMQIREYGEKLFSDKFTEYDVDMAFLALHGEDFKENLELDMIMDVHNPPQDLEAVVWVNEESLSFDKMAEIMLKTDQICKNDNIPVAFYDIRLTNKDSNLWLYDIPAEILNNEQEISANLEKLYNKRNK